MNFKDLINLTNGDNSKIFVVDDAGDVKLVVMGAGEFEHLLVSKAEQVQIDSEEINREILKAQLAAEAEPVITPLQNGKVMVKGVDMRAEVIDPTFDFDSPEEVEIDGL
jgi:hypothetical protein